MTLPELPEYPDCPECPDYPEQPEQPEQPELPEPPEPPEPEQTNKTTNHRSASCTPPMIPYILEPNTLFRGKFLLSTWLEEYQCETLALIREHGAEKVWKVYDWVFRYMQSMRWGQWLVVEKIAPDAKARRLLYWCMEVIYQSDLISKFRVEHTEGETRVVSVEPDPDRKKKHAIFMGADRYLLIDWCGRLRQDPKCDPDINPEWLGLKVEVEEMPPEEEEEIDNE